jgi:hypothetical protein
MTRIRARSPSAGVTRHAAQSRTEPSEPWCVFARAHTRMCACVFERGWCRTKRAKAKRGTGTRNRHRQTDRHTHTHAARKTRTHACTRTRAREGPAKYPDPTYTPATYPYSLCWLSIATAAAAAAAAEAHRSCDNAVPAVAGGGGGGGHVDGHDAALVTQQRDQLARLQRARTARGSVTARSRRGHGAVLRACAGQDERRRPWRGGGAVKL